MKNLLFSILCLFFCTQLFPQNLKAKYSIRKSVLHTDASGIAKTVTTLDYDGFFLKKDNQYIFFKRPLFLDKYPDGAIEIQTNNQNEFFTSIVSSDTIQGIYYTNADSLKVKYRFDVPGNAKITDVLNFERNYELGYQKWDILPDVKVIQGLNCQKAKWIGSNGILQWEVWFVTDVPINYGPSGIIGVPGLVVETECFP